MPSALTSKAPRWLAALADRLADDGASEITIVIHGPDLQGSTPGDALDSLVSATLEIPDPVDALEHALEAVESWRRQGSEARAELLTELDPGGFADDLDALADGLGDLLADLADLAAPRLAAAGAA